MPEEAEMVYTRIKNKWGLTPGAPSPMSPGTLANLTQQTTSQPISDLMSQNIQQQQSQALRQMSIAQYQTGLSAPMASSPADTNPSRRTSGGMSQPPSSGAELSRDAHRIRASTYLTQAQQDAWNAHQARLEATAASTKMQGTAEPNAAKLFGGVDSLMEETQDWFFKDQNALAVGFENWGGGGGGSGDAETAPDWGTLDLSFFDTPPTDGGGSQNENTSGTGNSPAYNNNTSTSASGVLYSYDPLMPPSSAALGDAGGGAAYSAAFSSAGAGYPMNNVMKTEPGVIDGNGTNGNMMGMGMGLPMNSMGAMGGNNMNTAKSSRNSWGGGGGGSGTKRPSQSLGFDDEIYY